MSYVINTDIGVIVISLILFPLFIFGGYNNFPSIPSLLLLVVVLEVVIVVFVIVLLLLLLLLFVSIILSSISGVVDK